MILPGQLKAIIIVNLLLISVSNAIIRPPVPTITGASFDGTNMTVDCTVDSGAYDSVHVVLLTDFTSSLSYACEFGNGTGEGLVVNYASKSLRNIFPLSNQYRERYFVAAATSKMNEDSVKIFSGWKVYTDNGLPVSITTSSLETCENLFYRARRVNESNKNQVVFDVTFSLPVSRASNCKFILKKGGTKIIDLPDLSSVPNAKTDLLDAIRDTAGIKSNLFFTKTEKGINQYRFYGYLDNSSSDPIEAILIDTAGLVLDTLKNHVGVSADNGYMNILSTIYALTAMPDSTTDPLNPGTIPSLTNSVRIKLLIAAVLDQSLAHNSPQADENEKSHGIFTNYMQFMETTVRNWSVLRNGNAGLQRLKNIFNQISATNKSIIIDPLFIEDKKLTTEYMSKDKKRENYLFCNGYVRLECKIDTLLMSDTTGTGILLSASENVRVYKANADEYNMFDSSTLILSGDTANCLIIRDYYEFIRTINNNGIWLKGVSDSSNEQFYFRIKPVRLPVLKNVITTKIDTAFNLTGMKTGKTDSDLHGEVICNEKNLLKIFPVLDQGNGQPEQIINNVQEKSLLLHGQKRHIEINSNYFNDANNENSAYFVMQGNDSIRNKILVNRIDRFRAELQDTSPGRVTFVTYIMGKGVKRAVLFHNYEMWHLIFKEAVNGVYTKTVT